MARNEPEDPLQILYRRPGFMIRRAHQIAVSLFMAETEHLGITKTQYGILYILRYRPGVSQIILTKLLGLDRSTTSMVVKKLEEMGLITLDRSSDDQRQRSLNLTARGQAMLHRLGDPVRRAEHNILAAFSPSEQRQFLTLLDKFVRVFNDETRVPILPVDKAKGADKRASDRRRPALRAPVSGNSRPR